MNKIKVIIMLILIIMGVTGIILSKREEVINNENIVQNQNETKIVLYFSNLETGELIKEYRYVELDYIKNDLFGTIMNELLKGPQTEELVSCIPEGTKVNSIKQNKNKIEIDFSKEYASDSRRSICKFA